MSTIRQISEVFVTGAGNQRTAISVAQQAVRVPGQPAAACFCWAAAAACSIRVRSASRAAVSIGSS